MKTLYHVLATYLVLTVAFLLSMIAIQKIIVKNEKKYRKIKYGK